MSKYSSQLPCNAKSLDIGLIQGQIFIQPLDLAECTFSASLTPGWCWQRLFVPVNFVFLGLSLAYKFLLLAYNTNTKIRSISFDAKRSNALTSSCLAPLMCQLRMFLSQTTNVNVHFLRGKSEVMQLREWTGLRLHSSEDIERKKL